MEVTSSYECEYDGGDFDSIYGDRQLEGKFTEVHSSKKNPWSPTRTSGIWLSAHTNRRTIASTANPETH